MRLIHAMACCREAATNKCPLRRIACRAMTLSLLATAIAGLHVLGQRRLRRNEDDHRIRIVLGLRDQVGRKKLRIAAVAVQHGLGRTGQHVDGAIEAHQFLGGGDKAVSRADDLVHARESFPCHRPARRWPARLRSDRLRECQASVRPPALPAADAATPRRCAARRRPARESRSSAAWKEADSGLRERSSRPIPADARSGQVHRPAIFLRHSRGICHWQKRRILAAALPQGVPRFARSGLPAAGDLFLRNPYRLALLQSIPQCGIAKQGLVSATSYRPNDLAHPGLQLV